MPHVPDEVPLGSWSKHPAPGTTSSRAAQTSMLWKVSIQGFREIWETISTAKECMLSSLLSPLNWTISNSFGTESGGLIPVCKETTLGWIVLFHQHQPWASLKWGVFPYQTTFWGDTWRTWRDYNLPLTILETQTISFSRPSMSGFLVNWYLIAKNPHFQIRKKCHLLLVFYQPSQNGSCTVDGSEIRLTSWYGFKKKNIIYDGFQRHPTGWLFGISAINSSEFLENISIFTWMDWIDINLLMY